jgi:phosphate transport system ATP-binding protein
METRGLSLWYAGKLVFANVNLPIRRNEITAIIGPSGSGKSSLLRCLNRMNELLPEVRTAGQVLLNGEDIYRPEVDAALVRRRIGMVFQLPNPFPLSIFENVAYGPRRHGLRDRRKLAEIVEQSLRQAALWEEVKDILHRSAWALSGGQQQRLCIARVIAVQPEVILMDEPASALDPVSAAHIEELMLQLCKSYTIVLVTHDIFAAARVAHTTALLMQGALIERPRDPRTEDYLRGRIG